MIARRIALLAAGSAALALGACSSPTAPEGNIETNLTLDELDANDTALNIVEPTPEPTVTPAPAPAGTDFGNAAETRDDAEAVGMTSRVDRGGDEEPAH